MPGAKENCSEDEDTEEPDGESRAFLDPLCHVNRAWGVYHLQGKGKHVRIAGDNSTPVTYKWKRERKK